MARAAYERWFDEPLARGMEAWAAQALAYARAPEVARAGPLGDVQDWDSVAATTVTVREARRQEWPGAGDSAAIKGPTVRSVGGGAPVASPVSPAREPDRRPLQSEAAWRGYGWLAALASARLERLRACDADGVRVVRRLHEHEQPNVEALLAAATRGLDGRALAAEVPGGRRRQALPRRLVGVQPPTGDGGFLTYLPPRIGPRQGADRSRVRWAVALSLRLDQSVNRLEAIDAERPCSLKTLGQASRIASTLAALLAPTHQVPTRPPPLGTPRTAAPLHPRRVALPRAVSCPSVAQAVERQGAEATRRWNTMAAWLTHRGRDPNGRRRPSVLAQRRGWKRQPVVHNKAHGGDVSNGH